MFFKLSHFFKNIPALPSKKGFTLIELLVVVGVIVVLAATSFVAVNPAKRLAQSRNSTRQLEIKAILDAVMNYTVDNNAFPTGIDANLRMLGKGTSDCNNIACGVGVGTPADYADDSLEEGTYGGTQWNGTDNWLELAPGHSPFGASGDYTSRIFNATMLSFWDAISWVPEAPYQKELPNGGQSESAYSEGNASMSGNVLLMHMNEASATIADSSGAGNNGANHGATYSVEGKFSSALHFNGINSYIEVPHSSSLNIGGSAITLEAWAKDPPAAWWPGYAKRKVITLNGAAGTGANYAVKLTVGESALSGADVSLDGNALDFPTDIRFADNDGTTPLVYWLQGVSGTFPDRTAIFWVKVLDDLGVNQDIYVYYGKEDDVSASAMWDHVNHLGLTGGVFDYNASPETDYSQDMQHRLGVSGQGFHTCVLKSDGNVFCWGDNSRGQSAPYNNGDAIAVAAGGFHTCVLKSDGNVFCWGDNEYHQADGYTGTDAVAVSAGEYHTCILKSNGNAHCFGANSYGQSAVGYTGGDAIAVAAGGFHTCVLKSDGDVHCWDAAQDEYGQAADYSGHDAIGLAAGRFHTCVLKSDGSVFCWGDNEYHQADGYTGTDAVAVSAGGFHTCVLKSDGQVNCWGDSGYLQSDHDASVGAIDYTVGDAIGVVAGGFHTCVLKADGNVDCWDASHNTEYGQAADYTAGDAENPFRPYADSMEPSVESVSEEEQLEDQDKTIISKGQDAYSLQMSNDGLTLYGYINNNEINFTPPGFNPETWHYFALTFDGASQKLYIDGVFVVDMDFSGTVGTNANAVFIGQFFSGELDEAAIYGRALSATEILDHYKRGALRLKFQARSCNDALCAGETFTGPDGTASSYYSELDRNSVSLPQSNLNAPNNNYFQYKSFFETDDSNYTPALKSVKVSYIPWIPLYTVGSCLDLSDGYLTPTYVSSIPWDPKYGNEDHTYYAIKKIGGNRIKVQACGAELGETIEISR